MSLFFSCHLWPRKARHRSRRGDAGAPEAARGLGGRLWSFWRRAEEAGDATGAWVDLGYQCKPCRSGAKCSSFFCVKAINWLFFLQQKQETHWFFMIKTRWIRGKNGPPIGEKCWTPHLFIGMHHVRPRFFHQMLIQALSCWYKRSNSVRTVSVATCHWHQTGSRTFFSWKVLLKKNHCAVELVP